MPVMKENTGLLFDYTTVTTGQCAAAAQRTLCPTDTITIQNTAGHQQVNHWGTVAYDYADCVAKDAISDTVKVE